MPILGIADMSATSAHDIWAVGSAQCGRDDICSSEIAVHWDGVHWRAVPSGRDQPRCTNPSLTAVTALTEDDAWALGEGGVGQYATRGCYFILKHWDGRNWKLASTRGLPKPAVLLALDRIPSSRRLFAAGFINQKKTRPLIARWNGKRWSSLPSPSARMLHGGFDIFTSIYAFAANDIWGVIQGSTVTHYSCRS